LSVYCKERSAGTKQEHSLPPGHVGSVRSSRPRVPTSNVLYI
jgi:hypothetical protein